MSNHPQSLHDGAHQACLPAQGMKSHENAGTQPPAVEKLLTYKQAGELLGVTERTVFTLVKEGHLAAVRFGRSVRIDPADLRAYIDRCKTPSSSPAAAIEPRNGGEV